MDDPNIKALSSPAGVVVFMEAVPLSAHFLRLSLTPVRFDPLFRRFLFSPCPRFRKWQPVALSCSDSASAAPIASGFGGWDDPELLDESYRSAELDSVARLLASLGITETKHGLLFALGFLSALVVSRVRISSLAILPVSAVIFAVGFSAGVSVAPSGSIRDFDVQLKDFVNFLKGLDGKLLDLRDELKKGIDSNRLKKSKIENFVEVIKGMRLRIEHAQKTLEAFSSDHIVTEEVDAEQGRKKSRQKLSRKRKEWGMVAYDIAHLFGRLLQENITALHPSNRKDANNKVELREKTASIVGRIASTDLRSPSVINESNLDISGKKLSGSTDKKAGVPLEGDAPEVLKAKIVAGQGCESEIIVKKFNNYRAQRYGDGIPTHGKELNNLNSSLSFITRQERYQRMSLRHQYDHMMQNEMHNSTGGCVNRKTDRNVEFFSEAAESSLLEESVEVHGRSYLHSRENNSNMLEDELQSESNLVDQSGDDWDDLEVKSDIQLVHDQTNGVRKDKGTSSSASSTGSADDEFTKNVKEASELLGKARVFMKSQTDESVADSLLHRSAKLLAAAVSLKPLSLLAIGQLGNTYLLHGKLKLKISRELRALLSKSDTVLNERIDALRLKKLDVRTVNRENVASALTDVCEECEELLVEAGRKYRIALTIDQSDIRALYNWGLALSYRAQLIADIGPAAAADADKVYMAAIDKFDAIVSRNNAYAPDALYRWGVALQQRSYLRQNNRAEKLKLLQQAKSLFEDVLYVQSSNRHAKEALSSCLSELNYHGQL